MATTLEHHAMRIALVAAIACVAAGAAPASAEPIALRAGKVSLSEYAAPPSSGPWTLERMRNAKPLPIPEAPPGLHPEASGAASAPPFDGPTFSGPAAPPAIEVEIPPPPVPAGETAGRHDLAATSALEEPSSAGTDGCHFSSSRLVPQTADRKYPHTTVGKLFFTKPGIGDFVCSGAVLSQRLVLTAGHCTHSGNGQAEGGQFTNFLFCPAYRISPNVELGCWTAAELFVTSEWVDSGNVFPNAADYAILEMNDNDVNGSPARIGDVTGTLGYATSALSANHVHMLGYPVNFDSGNKMHQITAGRCYFGGSNTQRYGSDMRGGSSGGPWVQDFGALANGQTVSGVGPNLIVGITSYSNVSSDPKYQGSSVPDARFETLRTLACAHRAGNCE